MAVILFFCTFGIILLINFLWSRRRYYAFALKMPGPTGLPFIGVAHKLYKKSETLLQLLKYARQYKVKTYFTWFGPYPIVYTMDPKIAEIILNSQDCVNKSVLMDVFIDMLGDGLLTSKATRWNIHRKVINPCFNYKVLLSFVPLFNNVACELCVKFDELVDCGEVNIKNLLFNMAMMSALGTTMGLDSKHESITKLKGCVEKLLTLTVERALNPFIKNSILFRLSSIYKPFKESKHFMMDFVSELVMNRKKAIEQRSLNESVSNEENVYIKKKKEIFIDQAIKIHQRNEFTISDVIAESNVMVFAAYETSASTSILILMLLAMHPEFQEKAFDEILTLFPDKDFDVNSADIKELPYLDMCINESLRISATVPIIVRICDADIPISKDVVIPKGTQICVDIFNIQRDEDVWGPTANTFDPDHFLPANLVGKHKYSFMPFSMGSRNCIGWQYARIFLKVFLAQVLRRYRFSTKIRFEDLESLSHLTVQHDTLPYLEIQKR